jgi:N-acetyl-alpha-D-muramate 1-phosphate uridylyltransferase
MNDPLATAPAQAILLAAGRGERMRPLTDHTPKPLLEVRGKPLMQWHMEALLAQGVNHIVINTAWLENRITDHFLSFFRPMSASYGHSTLLNTEHYTAIQHVTYSTEGHDFALRNGDTGALETAGGIVRALPALADTFWVLAGDVYAPQFSFSATAYEAFAHSKQLAHIWLVPNPAHNPRGDFGLSADGLALNLPKESSEQKFTYSTIGLYKKAFFSEARSQIPAGNPAGIKAPLAPLLRTAMDAGQVSAEIWHGDWTDVGTPERLAQLNAV